MSKAHGDFSGKSHLLLSFTKVPWGWGRSRYWGVEEIFKIDKKTAFGCRHFLPLGEASHQQGQGRVGLARYCYTGDQALVQVAM